MQGHLETYPALAREGHDDDGKGVPEYVEREFSRYLECGILAHGFARARCPACNVRRMAQTAAHLVEQVFPPLPVRQWVLDHAAEYGYGVPALEGWRRGGAVDGLRAALTLCAGRYLLSLVA